MRVLLLGRSRTSSAESSVRRALEAAGHGVALVDDRRAWQRLGRRLAQRWILGRALAFRPEAVLVGKGRCVDPDVLEEVCSGRRSAMWYHDLRVPPLPDVAQRARRVDVLFLTAGGQAPEYEALGVRRALFLPGALDAFVEGPAPPSTELAADVAFVGSGYDDARADVLAEIGRRFRLRVWGPGWERRAREVRWAGRAAKGGDLARICASAKVVLGVNPSVQARVPVWGYASNRMWRVVGSGGFFLGHGTPGVRELLEDGEHCAWYADTAHALDQIDRYLGDDAARDVIRARGRAFVLAHHTYVHRISNLLTGEPFRNPLSAARAPAAGRR